MDIIKRIAKAKTSLILEHPFIGTIALNMPTVLDASIRTAATNGKVIKYNPEFVEGLTDEQVKFLVAHECMHPMLEHNFRRNNRHAKKWNQAADYVVNKLLVDEGIGKFIDGGCLNDTLYNAGKGTSDGIYNLLPEPEDGDGDMGGTGQDVEDADGSPAEKEQEAAEWKVKVAQAAQAAKMMGKMSANMQRLVDEVLQPKVDWRDVLRRFTEKCRTDTRSWSRPNRRFLAQGMYLPSVSGEALGEVVVAVDCSGSISQRQISEFAAEIKALKEDNNPTTVHVVYFDSEVSHYESYGRDDDLDIKPHGGGGTAFSPVFKYIALRDIEPVACVFLTDLCCDDFGPAPDYPVLWVSTDAGKAPFGEVVVM
tara:strand:- start:22 stop:1122 length:1101 start_codon:yes stop_codon:yes gene_type:complete